MPKWAKILLGIVAVVLILGVGFLIYINVAYIGKEEAKEKLAEHINIEEDDLYFENVDLEMENSQYEIDFYYNNHEYEAKVDAKEGKVIYTDYPLNTTNNNTTTNNTTTNNGNGQGSSNNNNQNGNATQNEITLEEAKEISLQHANLNKDDVTLIKAEIDHDGQGMYEIEWRDATYEYDFDISKTGNILHYEKEVFHH